jgi:hypothetical protein
MRLESEDFKNGDKIPREFTCDGEDISPQLSWRDPPAGTKSFALSVVDPDAPRGTFVHWLVYDISKGLDRIGRGELPKGAKQARNDLGKMNYGGPCPPSGTHRYIFTLYALDVEHMEGRIDRRNFFEKVEEHALAKAELMGLYRRS